MKRYLMIVFTLFLAGSAWGQDSKSTTIDISPGISYIFMPRQSTDEIPWRPPIRYRTEVKRFDLCKTKKYAHPTDLIGYCVPYEEETLNTLLSQGWELQEPYRGEGVVWLKRQVRVEEE